MNSFSNQARAGASVRRGARRTLLALAGATCLAALAPAAFAQTAAPNAAYPNRPVRFVVPFPAASATDVVARTVAQKLGDKWGQPVVVENRPGAGGNLGTEVAAKSPNDGYTILWGTVANAISASLYPKLNYNFQTDFAPIMLVAKTPLVLVANKAVPASSVQQLITHTKGQSEKIAFGSGGIGTSNHLAGEMFNNLTGAGMVHVPYKGTPGAYTDLVAGRVQVMFDNIVAAMPQIKAGQLKAIAVTSAKRSAALPDVPTVSESGLPGFEAVSWLSLLVPTGTPQPIIEKVNRDVTAILAMPDVRERLAATGAELTPGSPAELDAFIKLELTKWAKAVKVSGAQAE
ncbi:MAG: tripartite tricarboxylate transporter substrate binding protein [Polaromonas sp.]|nr:tripartite tricarboxylate transporter substrate binding protein [Polaromonas sp.]